VGEGVTTRGILAAMDYAGVDELPVARRDGGLVGMVERRAVERWLYDRGDEAATAAMIAEPAPVRAAPEERIEAAVDRMVAAEAGVLPVVSSRGRLAGLLVRDDLEKVPGLVDGVVARRQQRETAAEAGAETVMLGCGLVSAMLGVALFALWIAGPAYGLPNWVAWVDGVVALLAFIGAVAASSREMISVPLWAVSGFGLCFAAAIGHALNAGPLATWLQLAFGLGFLGMVVVLGASLPRRHRRISVAG
jgi:hypothetical protein